MFTASGLPNEIVREFFALLSRQNIPSTAWYKDVSLKSKMRGIAEVSAIKDDFSSCKNPGLNRACRKRGITHMAT